MTLQLLAQAKVFSVLIYILVTPGGIYQSMGVSLRKGKHFPYLTKLCAKNRAWSICSAFVFILGYNRIPTPPFCTTTTSSVQPAAVALAVMIAHYSTPNARKSWAIYTNKIDSYPLLFSTSLKIRSIVKLVTKRILILERSTEKSFHSKN